MKRQGSWAAFVLVGSLSLAACGIADPPGAGSAESSVTQPAPEAGARTIVVGSAPTLPPLEYLDESNQVTGLIFDLLRAAAGEFGAELEFETMSFDALIPAVQSERIDMVTSMGNLPERRETLTFIVYLESGAGLLVPDGNPEDVDGPEDLCGLTVAFTRGSAQQVFTEDASKQCVANGQPPVTFGAYPGSSETVLALRSEQADAGWTDRVNAAFVQQQTPETFTLAFNEPGFGYGIGIPAEDTELLDQFGEALLTLQENGTYTELVEQYGLSESVVDEFTINGEQPLAEALKASS